MRRTVTHLKLYVQPTSTRGSEVYNACLKMAGRADLDRLKDSVITAPEQFREHWMNAAFCKNCMRRIGIKDEELKTLWRLREL